MKKTLLTLLILWLAGNNSHAQTSYIYTYAGSGSSGYTGDGGPATNATFQNAIGICSDYSGNIYIADIGSQCIRKIDATTRIIKTVAGTGIVGYSGDGIPATNSQLNSPEGIGCDAAGNLFIADAGNNRIRRVDAVSGIITTIVGDGSYSSLGDGTLATSAQTNGPADVYIDGANNIFITENGGNRIRRVDAITGIITTIAGNGISGFSGDGAPATGAKIKNPREVVVDASGNVYFADDGNYRIRKIDPSGIISTIAGNGALTSADGVPATSTGIYLSAGVEFDCYGNLLIMQRNQRKIRKVDLATGLLTTVAGGAASFYDGADALSVSARGETICADPYGNLYITSPFNVIYKITKFTDINLCVGGTTAPSVVVGGGTWSSSSTSVATISSTGLLTGTGAGTAIITYSPGGCSSFFRVTVYPLPSPISGVTSVCLGATATLSNTEAGGFWSSSLSSIATIGSGSGIATGLAVGSSVISYSFGGGLCAAATAFTVNPQPAPITGVNNICAGIPATFSDVTVGGTWGSSGGTITPTGTSAAVLSSSSAGAIGITYSLPSGCQATYTVSASPQPAISGPPSLCEQSSIALSESPVVPGSWASSNTTVATVSAIGTVSGVAAGTADITFTATAGACSDVKTVVVNPLPATITGPLAICQGAVATLLSATTGGTWASSAGVATITTTAGGTGAVAGTASGSTIPATTTITYRLTTTGCAATAVMTVNPQPAIAGPLSVCELATISLTETTGTPGTWGSGSGAIASVGPASGTVTGASAGTATISYTATAGGCYTLSVVTVVPVPAPIAGVQSACAGYTTTLSSPGGSGGAWSSTAPGTATVSSTLSGAASVYGIVTGLSSAATATISYTQSGCSAMATVTINPQPVITGLYSVCTGSSITLAEATGTAGTWSGSGIALTPLLSGTELATGMVAGSSSVSYTGSLGGCLISRPLTVNPVPSPVAGGPTVCQHTTIILTDSDAGGTWSSSIPAIASIGTGDVSGLFPGTTVISYSFPTGCHATTTITVLPAPIIAVSASGPISFCPGGSVTLSASPGYTYQWYDGSIAISSATGTSYTATTSGSFAVTATNASGCSTHSAATIVSAGASPVILPSGAVSFCQGGSTTLTASTGTAVGTMTYQWYRNGVIIPGATSVTFPADTVGSYTCHVSITTATGTCSGTTPPQLVTVAPLPMPVIHTLGDALVTDDHTYLSYQWYVNTATIAGATTWSVTPTVTGNYRLRVTGSNGCVGYSTSIYHNAGGINIKVGTATVNSADITIYPNPANNLLHISSPIEVRAIITGIEGKTLIDAPRATEINTSKLTPGIYLITIYNNTGERLKTEKLTIE